MHQLKDELEDLAFGVLNHEARESIVQRLNFLRATGGARADRIMAELVSADANNTRWLRELSL